MSDINGDIRDLQRYLDEQRKKGMLSKKSYEELLKRLKEDSESFDKNSKQLTEAQKKAKELKAAAKSFVTNSLRGAQSIRKNREDFRSLGPAVKAATSGAQLAGSALGKVFQTVGETASDLSIFGGPAIKLLGTIGGGALSVLGTFMDESAKKTAALANAFGQFALNELQNVTETYRTLGSVGAITSRGMNGVYDDAIRAGMGLKEYGQLVADQGQNFAFFAGSVTAGADALGKVSQANEGYKQEYLKLGYTYAEQQKYTGEYLKRNRLLQGTGIEDTNKLAEGSREYMDLLDEISRLTGQSRSEASRELEEQQSNVRFAAAQRIATKKSGDTKIADNMSKMSSVLKAMGGRGLAEGFQDLMSGMSTEAGAKFDQALGGEGQKIADMVRRGEIDANQGLQMAQQAARRQQAQVGKDTFAVRVGNTKAVMADILPEQTKLVNAQDLTVEGLAKANKDQQAAKKTKDKETENLVKAQDAMRKMAIDFDRLVQQRVFPLATEAVDEFTDLVVDFVNKSGDALGFVNKVARKAKPAAPAAAGGAAPTPEGGPQGPAAAVTGKPELTSITTQSGKTAQVNKDAAPAFQKIINWLEKDAGYKIKSIGGYADRDVRGRPGVKSVHSIGGAIDINPEQNPLGSQLVTDMPGNVGEAAKAYGLGWGGAWNGRKDAMHFSAATREGGKILQFATGGIASGPKSGYAAMLHGNEAVVPLPNGQDIPIQGAGMSESTEEQLDAIKRQNQIIRDLIAAARNNNDANKRLLSLKTS